MRMHGSRAHKRAETDPNPSKNLIQWRDSEVRSRRKVLTDSLEQLTRQGCGFEKARVAVRSPQISSTAIEWRGRRGRRPRLPHAKCIETSLSNTKRRGDDAHVSRLTRYRGRSVDAHTYTACRLLYVHLLHLDVYMSIRSKQRYCCPSTYRYVTVCDGSHTDRVAVATLARRACRDQTHCLCTETPTFLRSALEGLLSS